MVFYFTGTGNSKYVADMIADKLGEKCISLNAMTKNLAEGQTQITLESDSPFVIVSPIYAWRYPSIVEKLLAVANFKGNDRVYCVGTMGSQTGKTDKYLKKIIEGRGLKFGGFTGIVMPSNYIVTDGAPAQEKIDEIISKAEKDTAAVVETIKNGGLLTKKDRTPAATLLSSVVNSGFNKFSSTITYSVSDKCISCGQCESLCPVGNITMDNGRPVFGKSCTSCYACLQKCPAEAINIPGKTENKTRYVCREYKSE